MTRGDLSSGLTKQRERTIAGPPKQPFWSENLLFALYDPACDIGLWLHLGTVPSDWQLWEDRVLMLLPADQGVGSMCGYHRTPERMRPSASCLAFECLEPYRRWRITFDGFLQRTSNAQMAEGRARHGLLGEDGTHLDHGVVRRVGRGEGQVYRQRLKEDLGAPGVEEEQRGHHDDAPGLAWSEGLGDLGPHGAPGGRRVVPRDVGQAEREEPGQESQGCSDPERPGGILLIEGSRQDQGDQDGQLPSGPDHGEPAVLVPGAERVAQLVGVGGRRSRVQRPEQPPQDPDDEQVRRGSQFFSATEQ